MYPQGHRWIRSASVLGTFPPQREHSWLVPWASTAIEATPALSAERERISRNELQEASEICRASRGFLTLPLTFKASKVMMEDRSTILLAALKGKSFRCLEDEDPEERRRAYPPGLKPRGLRRVPSVTDSADDGQRALPGTGTERAS